MVTSAQVAEAIYNHTRDKFHPPEVLELGIQAYYDLRAAKDAPMYWDRDKYMGMITVKRPDFRPEVRFEVATLNKSSLWEKSKSWGQEL